MKLYSLFDPSENKTTWFGVRGLAQEELNLAEPVFRSTFLLTECEIATDKSSLIAMLNGHPVFMEIRVWNGTHRGGLKLLVDRRKLAE